MRIQDLAKGDGNLGGRQFLSEAIAQIEKNITGSRKCSISGPQNLMVVTAPSAPGSAPEVTFSSVEDIT